MSIEAMKQALEALESCTPSDTSTGHVVWPSYDEQAVEQAIASLHQAITTEESSAVQAPVAWMYVLATKINDGVYCGWENRLSRQKPNVPEGAVNHIVPLYAHPQPKAEQEHDEVTKLKGEIGVLVGLLGAAQQVIETIDAENAEESEALIHLHMKITYAIQGASSL